MELLYYIGLIPSILSFLGCSYIIITVLLFKELQSFLFRLILYLAISNLITSASILIPYSELDVLCKIQGFLISLGSLSSLLWTACIMYAIHNLIVKEKKTSVKFEVILNLLIWPLALFVAGINIPEYISGSGWCWISSSIVLKVLSFYGPYTIVLVFNLVICVKIRIYLSGSRDSTEVLRLKRAAVKKFMFYPLILIICYTPVIVHRFFVENVSGLFTYTLSILAVVGVSVIGFACFLLYALTRHVRNTIYQYFSPKIQGRDISLLSADGSMKD